MKKIFSIAVTMLLLIIITIFSYMYLTYKPRFFHQEIYSKILDEKRKIIVRLPRHYAIDKETYYPVIYNLDGDNHLWRWDDALDILFSVNGTTEAIVVGLPNTSSPNRRRDYTPPYMRKKLDDDKPEMGEAHKFLDFIEWEVAPFIEKTYRAAKFRMVAGHSRGGLCVMYSLIERPRLFQAHFAFSPAFWREDNFFVSKCNKILKTASGIHNFLYMSLGEVESERMTRAYHEMKSVLEKNAPDSLIWFADFAKNGDHSSTPIIAIPIGISKLDAYLSEQD